MINIAKGNIFIWKHFYLKSVLVELTPPPPIEKRSCPVDGCTSMGHLGGAHPRHFTVEACPIFHNTTPERCKTDRDVWMQMVVEGQKAQELMAKRSPRANATSEQRNYCNKIREEREKMSEKLPGEEEELADSDRQPSLTGYTPAWDLKLFLQAQQKASIKIEDDLRGLPDTKGIRYLEMGHYEMEAWYQSQYPDQYNHQPKIYVCEFCLKYMRSKIVLRRHMAKCVWRHPPGDEIYRWGKLIALFSYFFPIIFLFFYFPIIFLFSDYFFYFFFLFFSIIFLFFSYFPIIFLFSLFFSDYFSIFLFSYFFP